MNTVSSKLGNIAHELRKMVFGEFDRVFPNRAVPVYFPILDTFSNISYSENPL